MLITRIPPSVPELVARALADTPFLEQIAGAQPHQVKTYAELAASLAGEQWEAERHTLIGLTLPPDLIADVAQALLVHAVQVGFEADLHDWRARVERAITVIANLTTELAGEVPIPAAERLMDHVEGDLGIVKVTLKRALDLLERAIEAIEWAKSDAFAACGQ